MGEVRPLLGRDREALVLQAAGTKQGMKGHGGMVPHQGVSRQEDPFRDLTATHSVHIRRGAA